MQRSISFLDEVNTNRVKLHTCYLICLHQTNAVRRYLDEVTVALIDRRPGGRRTDSAERLFSILGENRSVPWCVQLDVVDIRMILKALEGLLRDRRGNRILVLELQVHLGSGCLRGGSSALILEPNYVAVGVESFGELATIAAGGVGR